MLTRRSLLQAVPAVLASLSGASLARASTVRPATTRRYFVHIVLSGGIDPLYFTDPKQKSEVDPDVDVPYKPDEILTIGKERFGPLFKPLAKWAPRMTAVNGVVLGTANHPAGLRQLLRFRSGATDEMPLAFDLIGQNRDGQVLPSVCVGSPGLAFMPNLINPPVLAALDKTPPEELRMLARVMRTRARAVDGVGDRATTASIEATARFFERVAEVPRFALKPPKSPANLDPKRPQPAEARGRPSQFGQELQRAAWLLENDLARGVILGAGNWDSHMLNSKLQISTTERHFPAIVEFLETLENAKNQHGSVFDNTLFILCSEIGRYPVLNNTNGKDHFPEAPFIFINGASGGSVHGQTGRRMQALPYAKRRTGKVTLTDVGMTVLRMGGVDPEPCGYVGEPLDFLGA